MSLTLTLSISSVCILAKQWIREYQSNEVIGSCNTVRVRQARYDSLVAWKLPQIMMTLPVILQAALLLFFAGLLDQLWRIGDHIPAICVSVIVGLAVMTLFVTTILPTHCFHLSPGRNFPPFRSPQAWVYLHAYRRVRAFFSWAFGVWRHDQIVAGTTWSASDYEFLGLGLKDNAEKVSLWADHNVRSVEGALSRICDVFPEDNDMMTSLFWCLQPQYYPSGLTLDRKDLAIGLLQHTKKDWLGKSDIISDIYFDLSNNVFTHATPTLERFQAELLVKSINSVSNILARRQPEDPDASFLWDIVEKACRHLKATVGEAIQRYRSGQSEACRLVMLLLSAASLISFRYGPNC